jgi:hypothetical protein
VLSCRRKNEPLLLYASGKYFNEIVLNSKYCSNISSNETGHTLVLDSIDDQINQLILAKFLFGRNGNTFKRLEMIKSTGLYRQSWQGNTSLYLAAFLNRI